MRNDGRPGQLLFRPLSPPTQTPLGQSPTAPEPDGRPPHRHLIEEPPSKAEPPDIEFPWERLRSNRALVRGAVVGLGLAILVGIVLLRPVGPVAKDRG